VYEATAKLTAVTTAATTASAASFVESKSIDQKLIIQIDSEHMCAHYPDIFTPRDAEEVWMSLEKRVL